MLFNLFSSGYTGISLFAIIVAYILALLFSLTFHEFAHAFVAYKEGDDTAKLAGRMSLNPLAHLDLIGSILLVIAGFGWAKPVPTNPNKLKKFKSGMIKVALAGIIANLIIAIIFSFLYVLSLKLCNTDVTIQFFIVEFCRYMCTISFVLGIFNLLPIAPLDGFALVMILSKTRNKFIEFMQRYSLIILIALLITPVFSAILNFVFSVTLNPLLNLWVLLLY